MRFEEDGTSRRELTLRVKVLDDQSVLEWGQLPLNYSSASEDLSIPVVEVHKPDGSIVKTAPETIQDVAVTLLPQVPMYLDLRQKVVTVAGLRPGDTIFLRAVWTTSRPIVPGHFWLEYAFTRNRVILEERLDIDTPVTVRIALRTRPGSPSEEHAGAGLVLQNRRIYTWKASNPTVEKTQGSTADPPEEAPPPDIRLSTFATWDDVGRWFHSVLPRKSHPAVQAKAGELTQGATDGARKIDALYRYVSTQVRYVSLSLGLGRFVPRPPEEVLSTQYGDCKDKALLLAALLSAAGIESTLVLLNSARSIEEDFPAPSEFDHVVLAVPGADATTWIWLDSTVEVAPVGVLLPALRQRRGLLVGDGDRPSRLVTSPSDLPFVPADRVEFQGTVNSIGVLTTRFTYQFRGDSELLLRLALRALPPDSFSEFMKNFAASVGLTGDVSDASSSDPVDTGEPLRISFTLRTRKYLDWAAPASEVRVGQPALTLPGWSEEERKGRSRIRFGSPGTQSMRGTIDFPDGYSPQAPVNIALSGPGVEYRSRYAAHGTRLTVDRDLRRQARDMPASQFGAYASFIRAVQADSAQRATVRASGSTPTIPAGATAGELYDAALSAYNAKRYDAAATLWKRTTDLDPKMGSAWVSLGLAYGKLDQHDAAAAAIRKQIELDPYDKRAHADLGYALQRAGRLSEAARAYEKHVELNPLDGRAHRELGELYSDLRRHADAAASLEKAAALLKDDGWMFESLGEAYLHLRQSDKAHAAFDRALAIDPSPGILTRIAWALVANSADLDRAFDLASQAVKRISEDTDDLTLTSLGDRHLDLMERLAWAWDVLGWVRFHKGDSNTAELYARAAWLLGGSSEMAYHLGRVYEKQNRLADALSFYLTAQAIGSEPPPEVMTHITHLSGGGDLKKMLATARDMAPADRTFQVSAKMARGTAEFLAVVGSDRHVLELQQTKGDERFRQLEPELRRRVLPVEFPHRSPKRLVLAIAVWCSAEHACWARTVQPRDASLPTR